MIYIDNEGVTDPHVNLAIEEHCIRHLPAGEDYLLFYINAPSIIIGRNQNTLEEIHQAYIDEHGIHVVRRISGGGAVYHDHGNLNFSFLTDFSTDKLNNFKQFATPIIKVLNAMGVAAEMKGRNDIVVGDKKISGNAQFSSTKRMFNHGTLLLDCDLRQVNKALDVKMTKIKSKGHKSARARVANIAEFLDAPLTTEAFKEKILAGIYPEGAERKTYRLSEKDWQGINTLVDEKYGRWEWNYGRSPAFDIQRTRHFTAGIIDFRLKVEKGGAIENVKIYGDFFGQHPVSDLEDALTGVRYDKDDIEAALEGFDLYPYFGEVDRAELIDMIYGPDER
ncbi:lipoate--protein ligase [Vreelandella subglaciescola]|jgi:lipoate-protein ligase A|uniref:lipoate--protein ligase n=1 Tax=Vreelandella subglaciescola TaxID=29571 RepID=A0A1M7HV53_9GAMM|nr:lipoate--protein ligase [Halomonas subglaciescola]SHM32355.1 lipoate-protein ligase [Halomonas subglaciescola]